MAKTSFYLSKDLENKLRITEDRGLSKTVSRTIDRFYYIIEAEKKMLSKMFTKNEWTTLRSICNGTIWEPSNSIRKGVLIKLQDSMDYEIKDFGADKKRLEEKLNNLSLSQDFALVEIIEEWWDNQ